MSQLKVVVNKLNQRSSVPLRFSENNIIGSVTKGYLFEGNEEKNIVNASLGKWYRDRDGIYYWGGGLLVLDLPLGITVNIGNIPANLPHPFTVGIDISHHNNLPDWGAIKNAGVSFTYIKLSEGVGTPDEKAKEHAMIASQNGYKIGFYHFCLPDTRNGGTVISDAIAEADEVISRMRPIKMPDLPLVLDLENQENWDSPLQREDYLLWINSFINRIKEKSGMESMIYSRKEYLDGKLPPTHDLGKYKLWISRYSLSDCNKVECPIGWTDWSIWQYCEDGIIGNNSKMDINILKDPTLF
jgi:lysozyme